jgi:alkylation response protein AidB-like acyl-CoA dehydrogenase
MDFGLSQDQQLLKETIRRFLDTECPTSRVRRIMESPSGHDPELWRGLAALGALGLCSPAEHGGAGLELLDAALAAEELGYNATPGPFLGNTLAQIALGEAGSEAQKAAWLPKLSDGSAIGSFALGEADGEWAPERVGTSVAGETLRGHKTLVPYGSLADVLIVAARDEAGIGLWLVRRDAPGMQVKELLGVDETRRLASLRFDQTPAERLPGGAAAALRCRDAACILLAADAYGGSRRMVDMTVTYAKQREQFGQIIAKFQSVKHQLADLAGELEPSLALWWYAAHAFDRIREESPRHAAIVKAHMSDVFDRIGRDTTELHGGIGFTWEYDLQLWFKRSMYDRSLFGEASDHRLRAAELAGW